jgi:outer membrane receptor protein involved in Fe transport
MEKNLRLKLVTTAILAAFAHLPMAYADEMPAAVAPVVDATPAAVEAAPTEAAVESAPLNLDKIVVTGSAKKISKMKSSVSISTMNSEQVQATGATNAAEVLRSIPGIRSESSGGEGNANMTVRGLPISAGGARYLQLQEDGLPILQFGDIAFATPDMFYRTDFGLGSLEVVRGGSGSTSATNSPGGIINFINNTGEVKGGKLGLTAGLNFNEWRGDFAYGGPLNDTGLRGFVSGFYRMGDGFRDANTRLEEGGQIKANITQSFDGGFVRASFKHLDDQTPVNLPVPITTNASGQISEVPGIDPLTATLYSRAWGQDLTRNGDNSLSSTNVNDAMTVKTDSIGLEGSYDFGDGWNISDKFRWADNSGRFIGIFPYGGITAGATNVAVFNTKLDDMSLTVNDAKISKAFNFGDGAKFTPSVGLYSSWQNVGLTWSFNSYSIPAINNPGTVTPLFGSVQTFGGCCSRDIDADYRTISPYISGAFEIGDLNADLSIRYDDQSASGNFNTANDAANDAAVSAQNAAVKAAVTALGANPTPAQVTTATNAAQAANPIPVVASGTGTFKAANSKVVDYNTSHTSWSAGANYRITPNLAVFGRASNGVAFNADRIMFGSANLNGGTIPINEVDQYEAGVKWRAGNFSTFVTLFQAYTDESNFDATTQISTANSYDTKGVEIEAGYSMGNFRIGGGLTYTDAEVTDSPGNPGLVGKSPNRQAKVIYQITPSYVWDKLTIGSSIIGTSSSIDSRDGGNGAGVTMPAFAVVNGFLRYQYDSKLQLSLSANNLFDTIGYTEAQGGVARSVDGRSVKASVVYSF